jgi:hypothetical protein
LLFSICQKGSRQRVNLCLAVLSFLEIFLLPASWIRA